MGQPSESVADLGWAELKSLALVKLGGERGEQDIGETVRMRDIGLPQQGADVGEPEPVGAGPEAGAADLGAEDQVAELFEQLHHGPVERGQSVSRWRPRTQWWGAPQETFLQIPLVPVEQRSSDGLQVGEAAVESGASDTSRAGDVVHRDRVWIVLTEQRVGRGEHVLAVTGCVGPLPTTRWGGKQIELGAPVTACRRHLFVLPHTANATSPHPYLDIVSA